MQLTSILINLMKFITAIANIVSDHSIVKSVSAVCIKDAIVANIEFSRFFYGTIYSFQYSTISDCIYHRMNDTPILAIQFTIPLNKCGTIISRNTRNIIDLIENRIYIQLGKNAQTSTDQEFLFTCQLVPPPPPNELLLQVQDEKNLRQQKQPEVMNRDSFWSSSSSSEKMKTRSGPDNNWGNWPIDLTRTTIAPESSATAGQMPSINRSLAAYQTTTATTATTRATDNESIENHSILMKVLEETKFWRSVVFVPLVLKKTPSPISTNISTVAQMNTEMKEVSSVQINSTNKWKKSLESVRIFATQLPSSNSTTDTTVHMEIQHGDEVPFGEIINRPVQIGENISLVIRRRSQSSRADIYKLFVHSCYASDEQGLAKIMLIDRFGCSVSKIAGQMERMKNAGQTYYHFPINAFKFPGPDDVYFSCAVDVTQNDTFPEICKMMRNEPR